MVKSIDYVSMNKEVMIMNNSDLVFIFLLKQQMDYVRH